MKEKITEVSRNGILIETADPQPAVRRNAEIARDWVYAEEATYLYDKAILFKNRFLDPVLHTDRRRLPDPVISFENLRNYTEEGEKKTWEFGRWAQLESLLHEQVHLWQQNFGKDPVKPGKPYHNKEFVEKCESLGLHPMPGVGCHTRLADGPFALYMQELMIEPPQLTDKPEDINMDWFKWLLELAGKRRKGRSSLAKWTCPECGLNVRIGIKGNPELRHDPCEKKLGKPVFFVQPDGLSHVIYKADKDQA